jgi:1,4-dihydroxy-2-naphthoate octaprenyltransferase
MKNPWIQSARLRTLPLALSGTLLAITLAFLNHKSNAIISTLACLTAVLLQILSNFANDYGDYSKGTDGLANRNDRMLTAGKITADSMKRVLWMLSALVFLVGCSMVYYSFSVGIINSQYFSILLIVGIAAIFSAIAYTIGKNAYGYLGLGDIFVFLFFGIVPVLGTAILLGCAIEKDFYFAAAGMGLLSTAVLNTNNYRDIESDKLSNKLTLATRLGPRWTLFYHRILLIFGFLGVFSSLVYRADALLQHSNSENTSHLWEFSESQNYLLVLMLFGVLSPSAILISQHFSDMRRLLPGDRENINPQLKKLSLSILLLVILYGIMAGFILSWIPNSSIQ